MGDNGAGKSTLVKLIAGNFQPSDGQIFLGGAETRFADSLDARDRGIEAVYQDLALCDNLTAADNVFLGREISGGSGRSASSTTGRWRGAPASSSPSCSPRPGRATWCG